MKTNTPNLNLYDNKRIIIIGTPGSGKSTLGKELSSILDLPLIHLDRIFWKPNWVSVSREEFDKALGIELAKDKWIIEGDFQRTLPLRMAKCDLVIFLDYDSETCVESYLERVRTNSNTKEGFITEGCDEKVDPTFIENIRDYNSTKRPVVYKLLSETNKPYLILENRLDKAQYIRGLFENKSVSKEAI